MPMVTVGYPTGQLSAAEQAALAGQITSLLREIEGGARRR
jgi:phenylpyruvate tautomerase PptA (4-oxalocrotonate tautomerase family)